MVSQKGKGIATGIFNSGTNVGAIIAPLTVPLIALWWGWQWAFLLTGSIGLLWLIFWFSMYEIPSKHRRLKKTEYDYIHSDEDETADAARGNEKVSWFKLLTYRQTWAFVSGKFLTDPVWWFYLLVAYVLKQAVWYVENRSRASSRSRLFDDYSW